MAVGGKGQKGRRPLRGENAKLLWSEDPEVLFLGDRKVVQGEETRGETWRERLRVALEWRESPRGPKPKRARVPTRTKHLGATRDTAGNVGKAVGAQVESREGF